MRRTTPFAALLAGATVAGCSLALDPDDHVRPPNPCDEDGDGHYSTAVECGGDDCDDADARRYPGAVPRCDGEPPADCNATELQPQLRTMFGVAAGVGVDYGELPMHTDASSPSPGVGVVAPSLAVHVVGFETDDGGQASVAFVGGETTVGNEPVVYLFDYALLDPENGRVDDPGLGDPSAFAFGGIDATTARVLATQRGFTGVGPFLRHRDVTSGSSRPTLVGQGSSTLSGNATGTVVRNTVALAGAYVPARNAALSPQMMWMERLVGDGGFDRWARLPWDDTSPSAYRWVPQPASVVSTSRIAATTGPQAFAVTQGDSAASVWTRAADSDSAVTASGVPSQFNGVPTSGIAPIEPVIVSFGTSSFSANGAYGAFYVETDGGLHAAGILCVDSGQGESRTTSCIPVGDATLPVPGVEITALAAAASPGAGGVLALVAKVSGTNQRGVLLYYLDGTFPASLVPIAPRDGMGRPWLVRPEEENGHLFERIAVTLLDHPMGATQRWTVVVAGVSDPTGRENVAVTVTGAVACIP